MKATEVHKLNADELKVEAQRLRRKLYDLRTQTVTEKIEDTSQFRKTRKDLARVLTEANGRAAKSETTAATATPPQRKKKTGAH